MGRFFCPNGHAFDISRSGYINLLQPQDKRSNVPGDTAAALSSRRSLHGQGFTKPLLQEILGLLSPSSADTVLDIGCGDGFYLGSMADEIGFEAHGIDIATRAAELAAKRYPNCTWVVANADRFIPYQDAGFSKLLSLTARMHPTEFHRILQPDGKLLIALPAPNDLIELRGSGRDRTARTVEAFSAAFELVAQKQATTTAFLNIEDVHSALLSIYRPKHIAPLQAQTVTLSLDLLLFQPRHAKSAITSVN